MGKVEKRWQEVRRFERSWGEVCTGSGSFHAAQGFMPSRRRRSASAVSLITTIFMIAVMMVSVAWLGPLSRVPRLFHSFPFVAITF